MTESLMQAWLDSQAMSIGKSPLSVAAQGSAEGAQTGNGRARDADAPSSTAIQHPAPAADPVQPKDYYEPIPNVCPSCSAKYVGFSCPRSACKE